MKETMTMKGKESSTEADSVPPFEQDASTAKSTKNVRTDTNELRPDGSTGSAARARAATGRGGNVDAVDQSGICQDDSTRMEGIPECIKIIRKPDKDMFDLGKLTTKNHLTVSCIGPAVFKKSANEIIAELKEMNRRDGLLYVCCGEMDFLTSGFDPDIVNLREKLEGMSTVDWRLFFSTIEETGLKIKNLWVGNYLKDGHHKYHRDKGFRGKHRWIISIGCYGKQFWMKCCDEETGLALKHGTMVVMDEKASGNKSKITHATAGKSVGSWIVVFET